VLSSGYFGDPKFPPTNTAANCSHFEKDGVEKHELLIMKLTLIFGIFIDLIGTFGGFDLRH